VKTKMHQARKRTCKNGVRWRHFHGGRRRVDGESNYWAFIVKEVKSDSMRSWLEEN
jgi:hypothetical protein